MKYLSFSTGNDGVSPYPNPTSDGSQSQEAELHRKKIEQHLTELLLSENLLVLCGLGTSLCLRDCDDGKPLAPTMGDLWSFAKDKAGIKFDAIKESVKYKAPEGGDNIELLLSHCQLSQILQPSTDIETFISETEALIVEKCRFINDGIPLNIHESFLLKVARRSTRQPRIRVFTTNYDLCFETAASHARFVVVDGFSHTQPQEFDGAHFNYDFVRRDEDTQIPDYIPNVFHLYKIHGSIDWELSGRQIKKSQNPAKPLIIYPRHSKFESSYNQPFLEMMSRFQVALRHPNTGLLIIGFGFNDGHITQPILSAFRSNVSLKAMIVSPSLEISPRTVVQEVASLIRKGDTRLALLSASFEELVPILPDLMVTTYEEKHRERFRTFGTSR